MDRLKAMRVLVRVAERGNFSRAAADLGLSHGMAGAIVKGLEDALGVELIRRTTRRMSLTAEGALYVEQARRILEEIEALDQSVTGRSQLRARLTLQVPSAFGRLVLAPAIGGFLAEHPEIDLSVLSRDRFPDMVADAVDVLVYVGPLRDSALVATRIGQFPIVTVAAPSYLASRGMPATIAELAAHDRINILSATEGRALSWRFREGGTTRLEAMPAALSFESSEAAVAAAIGGAGVVQNIAYAVMEPVRAGSLVPLLTGYLDPGPEIFAVTRRHRRTPHRIRALLSFLRRIMREHPAHRLLTPDGAGQSEA